ncbi:MAG: AAA family ATPase [bacterium]|nr:AAA family ATPase [bacterium]
MEHTALVEALKQPDFYDHKVEEVRYLQTHISSVFLTGTHVYKLKKPVNFGFLDFSTLELREQYCKAEVELNRRLAPAIYLGAVPITNDSGTLKLNGTGDVVDWLVVMRQLDEAVLGSQVLERGELGEREMDTIVEVLVPFYERAATGGETNQFGEIQAVRFNTDENFSQTEEFVGKMISRERFEHIRDWTSQFYSDNAELFESRIRDGRIRESHGDLHLGNIFFEEQPVVFDCIEFNQRFRCGDVAVDLAFLAMDLDFHGMSHLGDRFIDGYVKKSGDTRLPELLDFYKCYRAYVRGKIACFTASDPALDPEAKRVQRNLARRYFGLAYRYAEGTERSPLVVLWGMMGTGKTKLGRFLRERFGWHLLSTDGIRKQIAGIGEDTRVYVPYNEGLYSPEMNQRTYEEVCSRAESLLSAGFPVLVDGAFKRESERQYILDLEVRADAKLVFLRTTCSVEEQHRRLQKRQQYDTRSDGRVELMEAQRGDFELPRPTDQDPYRELATDGPVAETQARAVELLSALGIG